LERLSIPTETLPAALAPFAVRGADGQRLCEGVLLSTCNRTELYAAPWVPLQSVQECPRLGGLPRGIVEIFSQRSGLTEEELAARLYRYDGWAAADHLFRVVCGLDSLVVGESQIIGQVARAYAAAQAAGTAGVVLSTLFQEALRGGRRARARIGIGRSSSNVGSIAVGHAEKLAGPLSAAGVVVVGTGEIGRIVLGSLRERGVRRIDIVSRSAERAAAAAERWGCKAHGHTELPALLDTCDALISTTRASGPLLDAALLDAAMSRRAGRRLLLIDIAVPRTIDPRARGIEGVTLLDIDSFKAEREASPRSPEILRAESLIEEDLAVLKRKMTEMALRPVIGGLWRKAASIRGDVLERTRAQLPHLDEQSWSLVEDLATSLVARLLHEPATRLRAEAGNGHAAAFAEALRELFGVAE
jgi:glutamyl-tRNA reductase